MFSAQLLERKHGIIVLVYHYSLLFISERINRSRARILLKLKHLYYNLLDLQYYDDIIMVVFIKWEHKLLLSTTKTCTLARLDEKY